MTLYVQDLCCTLDEETLTHFKKCLFIISENGDKIKLNDVLNKRSS